MLHFSPFKFVRPPQKTSRATKFEETFNVLHGISNWRNDRSKQHLQLGVLDYLGLILFKLILALVTNALPKEPKKKPGIGNAILRGVYFFYLYAILMPIFLATWAVDTAIRYPLALLITTIVSPIVLLVHALSRPKKRQPYEGDTNNLETSEYDDDQHEEWRLPAPNPTASSTAKNVTNPNVEDQDEQTDPLASSHRTMFASGVGLTPGVDHIDSVYFASPIPRPRSRQDVLTSNGALDLLGASSDESATRNAPPEILSYASLDL